MQNSIKLGLITLLLLISEQIFAEYYWVSPARPVEITCPSCSKKTYVKPYHPKASRKVHRTHIARRRSHYSISVYYPPVATARCICEDGWTKVYCDCCGVQAVRSSDFLIFSTRPTRDAYTYRNEHYDVGPDYDLSTGDDNTYYNSNMQIN